MAADKLQEAITLIRSGDRQNGQKLLTEVLNAQPRNETAWLWMSALVSGEKRRFCLEKVLSINPNHAQARGQLAKLTAPSPEPTIPTTVSVRTLATPVAPVPVEAQPVPPPASEMPDATPAPAYVPVQGVPLPKVWLKSGKYLASILYLEGNNLLAFDVPPDKASEVLEEVRLGVTQQQFGQVKSKFGLTSVNHILFSNVNSVTLFGDAFKIIGVDKAGHENTVNATVSEKNAEAVLKALHQRLGLDFQRINKPISRLRVMMSALALFLFTSCGTGFLYWFVQGLKTDIEAAGGMAGSARARGLAALLLLIGPNGFLCIGGLVLVVVIVAMISSLRKPPEETILARVSASEKSS
jgi:hypothetical protein